MATAMVAGTTRRAFELLEESEARTPGRFRVPWLRGVIHRALGNEADARAAFEEAQRRVRDALPEQREQLEQVLFACATPGERFHEKVSDPISIEVHGRHRELPLPIHIEVDDRARCPPLLAIG